MQVLIVDDDDFALSVLSNTLSRLGYTSVEATSGKQAMEILRQGEIRLVITDWDMPEMNGIELCRSIRGEDLSGYIYVIMLTAREGNKQRMEGLCAGADDFINKPLDPEELLVCLKTAERILALETRDVALFALAKLAESRDSETGDHIERVQAYTKSIAKNLSPEAKSRYGVDDEYVRLLHQTSPLHDLGKVGIPDAILLKPGKLTAEEFTVMKTHTLIGADTLDAALKRFPSAKFLQMAKEIAATHHEKFDGSGYPNGLAGEQIPLCGRIVAVADVYDALSSRRIYKSPMTHEQAKAIIIGDQGTHFDPEVVQAFLRAEKQILATRESLSQGVEMAAEPRVTLLSAPPLVQSGPMVCSILVAEDDPVIMDQLIELLSVTGERVYPVTNGEDALQVMRDKSPRVVVSDWVMPKMDGVELCRRIRLQTEFANTHFIMLTANSDKSQLLDAYKAGVDDFVSKPFEPETFLARVRAGVRTARLREELIRKAKGSQEVNAQLATMNSRLERLAITDELTGLSNRRHGMDRLAEQWDAEARYTRPLTIAMIDVDHFKQINDTHGHDVGDAVLKRLAAALRKNTRNTDTICRMGGDEFLMVFPSQTIEEAAVCAQRCITELQSNTSDAGEHNIKATISVGLATRTMKMSQMPDLLKAADEAMYAAKQAGRNVIWFARSDSEQSKTSGVQTVPAAVDGSIPMSPASATQAPIDSAAVLKRCGGDPKFAAAVSERFRTQAIAQIVKIEEALAAKDADGTSRAAHSMKSMSAYMAADAAVELAKQIESLARENRLAEIASPLASLRAEVERAVAWINQQNANGVARCA